MLTILSKRELCPNNWELVVRCSRLAKKARPGHFVIVMGDAEGERIPLTVADYDADAGTITLVIMTIGTSTKKLVSKKIGDKLLALIGPLGHASELENFGKVIMVAGGVGAAPIYPIAKALKEMGNHVITIHGARNRELLFWTEKMKGASSEYILVTDDGSRGRKGLVTEPLRELLEEDKNSTTINCVYVIGPAIMMKFATETVRPFGVKTVASLNTIMIDGTGMCGCCRVKVGNETKFTCVDGPEFDALAVDWDMVLARQKIYCEEEKCSLTRYVESAQL